MTDYWDGTPEEDGINEEVSGTFVFVNGSYVTIEPGQEFIPAIKEVARNAGLGKFRVFLDGEEFTPEDAPTYVEEGFKVELRKYDQAG